MTRPDDANYQRKLETEREEAATVLRRCFFDDHPSVIILNDVPLCATHDVCNTCLKLLTTDALMCRCEHEGYYVGHAEVLWCSQQCLDNAHPTPDMDDQEEEA